MQNSAAGGEIISMERLHVQRLSERWLDPNLKRHKKRLKMYVAYVNILFIVKKNKHRLFLSHNDVKTPYTLALEELTRPIKTTDVLTFICGSCRTLLNK